MTSQIPVPEAARADESPADLTPGPVHEALGDVAYRRLGIVNVAFVGAPGCGAGNWVLLDAGLPGTADRIREVAAERFAAGGTDAGAPCPPAAILMTHGHFDHVGVLEELAAEWDVPVLAHPAEAPFLTGRESYPPPDPMAGGGLVNLSSALFPRGPVDVGDRLRTLETDGAPDGGGPVPPLPGWRWLPTPGHTPGHVSFWRPSDRTLLSGDAVISTEQESAYAVATQREEVHGPPMYFTPDWSAAAASARKLAALEPETLVTGHGRALAGPAMRSALRELADRFEEVAVPAG
ncbi:MBL fold metallo-hydrolase [Alienimonas sp. DA493]|uniref:MBL fold metallo-hydrolase n=1 Tax=Alienimonas sp. DA493 TaxID=3373605 RepID=UPI00375486ED